MKQIERNDPVAQSADVVTQNIEALKSLFPDAVAEGKIDLAVIKELIGKSLLPEEERDEKYGLNWFGKRKARQIALTPSTGTLRPCPEDSVDWDTTKNLMIEGDNLEVLKLLQKSYAGKVKLIYIDPPYNTGKDFVYPDNFQDNIKNYLELTGQIEGGAKMQANTESSGRYHTDWLNMMYPRLKLSWSLLSQDGFLLVSCDDNENASLLIILKELFGEDNYIGTFIVNATPNALDYGHIAKMHEFVHFFSKNAEMAVSNQLEVKEKSFKYHDSIGGFNIHPLYNSNEAFTSNNRPNLFYPIYLYPTEKINDCFEDDSLASSFLSIGFEKKNGSIEIYPPKSIKNNVQFVWRWGKEKCIENFNKEIVGYCMDNGEYRIVQKMRHTTKIIRSIIDGAEFSNRRGTAEAEQLLGGKIVSFPKPISLLQTIIQMGMDSEGIILDYFAGSGTTAHAIMIQNALDSGKRRFILVQLPEQLDTSNKEQLIAAEFCKMQKKPLSIAELTKERLRRAGKKIKEENPMFTGDTGFRVFKLDTSNIRPWEPDWDNLDEMLKHSVNHIKDGRSEEDILYELLLKLGLDLSIPIEEKIIGKKKVQAIGAGTLIVCLDKSISRSDAEPLALGIVEWQKQLAPVGETTCVFLDSAFADDVAKSNLSAILQQHGLENVRSL